MAFYVCQDSMKIQVSFGNICDSLEEILDHPDFAAVFTALKRDSFAVRMQPQKADAVHMNSGSTCLATVGRNHRDLERLAAAVHEYHPARIGCPGI